MEDGVVTLREAQSPEELRELILDVSKRLTKIDFDWWTRTHPHTQTGEIEGGFAIVAPDVEAAWHRDKAADEYRDALRQRTGEAVALRDAWCERVAVCTIDVGLTEDHAEQIALNELEETLCSQARIG